MTKTLTEQWKNGELDEGYYYVKTKWKTSDNKCHYDKKEGMYFYNKDFNCFDVIDDEQVAEVLAPVPSYEKWKEISESEDQAHAHLQDEREKNMCLEESVRVLSKQLAIATKALKDVAYLYIYTDKDLSTVANNALKEMEGVK